MDEVGRRFWKRFAFLVIVTLIIAISIGTFTNWAYGLIAYFAITSIWTLVLMKVTIND